MRLCAFDAARLRNGHRKEIANRERSDDQSCAELLVSVGCDVESWTVVDGVRQTLFHYMMNLAREDAAVFLIKKYFFLFLACFGQYLYQL